MKTSNRTRPLPQEVNFSAPTRLSVEDYRALNASSAKPILKPKAKRATVRRHMLGTEIQKALFAQYKFCGVPGSIFFANPLGGKRDLRTAITLKREGVKAGVLDCWGRGVDRPSGIWVEMKGKNEALLDSQKDFIARCEALGERVAIIRSLDEGLALLEEENILRGSAS